MNHHEYFAELLEQAKTDDNILSFFLTGSRGKGYENESSDYDICMIVKDDVAAEYKKKFGEKVVEIDLSVMSLSELNSYAEWQSDFHWDRYDFAHVQVLVDKTGEIQKIVDQKGAIPKEKKKDFIHAEIDGYLNGFFRSVKACRRKDVVGMRLEAAGSIPYLLNALFALEGRHTPFLGYLTRELEARPLQKLPWSPEKFTENLLKILENADLSIQQELAKNVEKIFREEGYDNVFDAWEGKDQWAMNYHAGN